MNEEHRQYRFRPRERLSWTSAGTSGVHFLRRSRLIAISFREPDVQSLPACILFSLTTTMVSAQAWTPTATTGPSPTATLANDGIGVVAVDNNGATFVPAPAPLNWAPVASPAVRNLAAILSDGPSVFSFAGINPVTGAYTNEVSRFDRTAGGPGAPSWVSVTMSGNIPPTGRIFANGAFADGSTAVLVGGVNSTALATDTSFLFTIGATPNTASWSPLSGGPTPRLFCAVGRGPGATVVVFGGDGGGGVALNDTWVFTASTGQWSLRQPQNRPGVTIGGSMAFDPGRGVTVLSRAGETWEWDGTDWVQVVTATLSPGSIAFDPALVPPAVVGAAAAANWIDLIYTPSIAAYGTTLPNLGCFAGGNSPFRLTNVPGSLPRLARTFQLQLSGVSTSAALFAAAEPSTLTFIPWGCNCNQGLGLTAGATIFIPNVNGLGSWSLPIPLNSGLIGLAIDMQGFALNFGGPANCPVFAASDRGTAIVGG
jgi:hypothetical protein